MEVEIPTVVVGQPAIKVPGVRPGAGLNLLDDQGFTYSRHKRCKNSQVWRCTGFKTKKCGGQARTEYYGEDQGVEIFKGNTIPHDHDANRIQVLANIQLQKSKQALKDNPHLKPREVMHSFNKAVDHAANGGPSGAVPKPASLARDLRRLKQTTLNYPPAPGLPCDIVNMLPDHLKEIAAGEQWVVFCGGLSDEYDPTDPAQKEEPIAIICVSQHASQTRLPMSADHLGDGTFKTAPTHFLQLYTIFSRNEGGLVLPAVFSFLPRKSMEWYRLMWEVIFEQMGSFTGPDSFIMDFELAVRNSLLEIATGSIKIIFCWFHFRKNVRAKYVELGFEEVATAANANPALALFYRRFNALVFVPAEDVFSLYDQVVSKDLKSLEKSKKLPKEALAFKSYIENTYVGKMVPVGKNSRKKRFAKPQFDPAEWGHFQTLHKNLPTTTNSVEGWHSGWNQSVGSNQTIWRVLDYLKEEESTAKMAWRRAAGEAFDRAAGDPEVDDPEVDEGIGEGDARVTGTKKRRSSTLKYQTLQNLVRNYEAMRARPAEYLDLIYDAIQQDY